MRIYSAIKCVVIIAALLFSQLSSAFASMPLIAFQKPDCAMTMLSANDSAAHADAMHNMHSQNMTTHTSKAFIDETSNNSSNEPNTNENLNCCEMGDVIACCDAGCQCNSLISSVVLIDTIFTHHLDIKNNNAIAYYMHSLPQPHLHLPKRPPINILS